MKTTIDQKGSALDCGPLAELISRQTRDRFMRDGIDPVLIDSTEPGCSGWRATVRPGSKYTKIDVGGSGRYMVDNATGEIFGIKGYGVIHRGHYFGTLDTINDYFWGEYRAVKLPGVDENTAAQIVGSSMAASAREVPA